MVSRNELKLYLDELLLQPCQCEDSSNNGLQVEGAEEVYRVVFGVDACSALFAEAVNHDADFIFVHHGMSWRDSFKYLTGTTARRLRMLFQNNISLYAAHLPLDQHPEVGHNAVIAARLGIIDPAPFFVYGGHEIGFRGRLPGALELSTLAAEVDQFLHTDSQVLSFGPQTVETVGIVSGGAADAIAECAACEVDCLLTGEMTHTHYHTAEELCVNVIAAGHYRSEVPGVEAIQERITQNFDVECVFADIPTGY
jgi:dinuclear metal center YbgI/SA1388 family protein